MKWNWWKIASMILVIYVLIAGLLGEVPRLPILNETIRNLYFHVTMWFSMILLYLLSLIYSIRFLRSNDLSHDDWAVESAISGLVLGALGLVTGMLWARFTWGAFWVNDPKLNGAAIAMLIYFAYFILRQSFDDERKRARLSAVYNIFAFIFMIVFIGILPRLTDSLHPGNGGNPAFSQYDLNSEMRKVFYPAVIGWVLVGYWIVSIRLRIRRMERKLAWKELNK
ncbi:MAG: cytochrome c biogenesis protein CcsA [Flavobacteriales bacterium]|nr:cytochrome c biogenesis protein CcsA [Flavobacteriales bacterium]